MSRARRARMRESHKHAREVARAARQSHMLMRGWTPSQTAYNDHRLRELREVERAAYKTAYATKLAELRAAHLTKRGSVVEGDDGQARDTEPPSMEVEAGEGASQA